MQKLLIGFDEAVVAKLDAMRGLVPRTVFIRDLVSRSIDAPSRPPAIRIKAAGSVHLADNVSASPLFQGESVGKLTIQGNVLTAPTVAYGSRLKKK